MAAKASLTGITSHKYGTEPTDATSQNAESAKILGTINDGVKEPAPQYARPAQAGSKAKGATRTKGGAI